MQTLSSGYYLSA